MCLNIGTPKNHHYSSGTNGKVVVLGVPILKHFRVFIEKRSYLELWFTELIASIKYGLSAVNLSSHIKLCICEFIGRNSGTPGTRSYCGIFFLLESIGYDPSWFRGDRF